jgi:hypothetical protein
MTTKQDTTPTLADLWRDYSEARGKLEARRDALHAELADVQREALRVSIAGEAKASTAAQSRLEILTSAVASVAEALRTWEVRQAEAEVTWATNRAATLNQNLGALSAAAKSAHERVRVAESDARAGVVKVAQAAGEADQAVRDATGELAACQHTIGAGVARLARLNPPPADPRVAGLSLDQLIARFVVVRGCGVDGRGVVPGEIVELTGPDAVSFSAAAAKAAPGRLTPLREILELPADPGPLHFICWVPAPPPPPKADLNIPKAEIKPAHTPAPRRVRVLSDIFFRGGSCPAGTVLNLTAQEAADLRGNTNLEAAP